MNKRSKSIASMFATRAPDIGIASMPTAMPERFDAAVTHVSAASVRSIRESFTGFERENEELREQIGRGVMIVEIDPALIDPSPMADRFEDEDDSAIFDALCRSIEEHGQEVPVLLREHPFSRGRYQSAYGHRRIRVARVLGRPVRAMVRVLSDEDLVIAQGMENSAREDLTYIERAVFAAQLEQAGHDRRVIGQSLSLDKGDLSKLISVARTIPEDTIRAIGRAPKAGRTRWLKLAESMSDIYVVSQLRRRQVQPDFLTLRSDARFVDLLRLATRRNTFEGTERLVLDGMGRQIATLSARGRDVRLVFNSELGLPFAQFVENRLPSLVAAYRLAILGEMPNSAAEGESLDQRTETDAMPAPEHPRPNPNRTKKG